MDKCWFVLQQVHYYPPPDESIKEGRPDGPLCLGHLIPSLRQLDHVINADEFVPFEKRMKPLRPTTRYDFTWDQGTERDVGLLASASVPLAAGIPGLDGTAAIGGLFRKRVSNYCQFSSLEQWILSPSRSYVNNCLKTEEVKDHIKRTSSVLGTWTLYMITGLAIARGVGSMRSSKSKGIDLVQSVGCQVPGLVEVGPEIALASRQRSVITERETTDFVWAVRLAKITKNGLQRDWSIETVFGRATILGRRATFSSKPAESPVNPAPILAAEQLDESDFEVVMVDTGKEEEYFIEILDANDEGGESVNTSSETGA